MKKFTLRLKKLLREPVPTTKASASSLGLSGPNPGDGKATTYTTVSNFESNLERLPAEVRRHILSLSDLHCLKALICASPIFHQQYLLDRRLILANSIDTTLGSACIDAHAVLLSEGEGCKTADHSNELVQSWCTKVQSPASRRFQLAELVTEEEAISMASYYFRKIVPIARQFACLSLEGLTRQRKSFEEYTLGTIEWQRLVRAIYRFQLLCYTAYSSSSRTTVSDNTRLIFQTIEPWEVEELFSFYQFAEDVYNKIFDRIRDELHPNNPRFADQERPPTPEGAFEFDNSCKQIIAAISSQNTHILCLFL